MREPRPHWQKVLADGLSSVRELLNYLELPVELGSQHADQLFKTRVPKRFAARMQKGNPQDPLLRQVLGISAELQSTLEYSKDPLKESHANPVPGLIHKYMDRVLLTFTGICAINCRFCFRRHFPYAENNPGIAGWEKACDYIAERPNIHEVILSGGDPMLASNQSLTSLIDLLRPIEHVRTLRFHTRVPIVLPERIQPDMLALIDTQRFNVVVVLHCNHPHELDESVAQACTQMKQAHWTLLNQSVLLKGVNDTPDILEKLSRRLFDFGVLPYYLHLLDKVEGTGHFDVDLNEARFIFRQLQRRLPGYLVPRLAREEHGIPHKTLFCAD